MLLMLLPIGTIIKVSETLDCIVISGGCADCIATSNAYLCGELPPCTLDFEDNLDGIAYKEFIHHEKDA